MAKRQCGEVVVGPNQLAFLVKEEEEVICFSSLLKKGDFEIVKTWT